MKSEFALAFNQICAEYSLPQEVVLEAVRAALVTAYRRDWKVSPTQNVTAEINFDTGLARIYVEKVVVDDVEDTQTQINLSGAKKKRSNVQVGDLLMMDVTPHDFGRIAAQTAKQVITQRLREAERESQFNRFSRQEGEIIIGTIQSIKPQGFTLHLERREEAHMPKREQIPGERYTLHQKIRVYVLEVRRSPRGPEIIVSRSHPRMLRRLLELEVPEIRSGQVEVISIAREAGSRSKVAVVARQAGLDPVGACVGMRGIRIQTISHELHGERIDVVEWAEDPATFIGNALSMNQVLSVILDEHNRGGRTASVVVTDDQLSLAIGRAGQNARLAAKLTGWRVDIQGATEAALWALEQVNTNPEIVDHLKDTAMLIPKLANVMRIHEKDRYPYTDEEQHVMRDVIEGVRLALISLRNAERPGSRQARARRSAQQKAEAARVEAEAKAKASVPQKTYMMDLTHLEVSDKVLMHLKNNKLETVGEVLERVAMGDEALLMLTGIGTKALREIKQAVDKVKQALAAEVEVAVEEDIQAVTEVVETEDVTSLATEDTVETVEDLADEQQTDLETEEAPAEAEITADLEEMEVSEEDVEQVAVASEVDEVEPEIDETQTAEESVETDEKEVSLDEGELGFAVPEEISFDTLYEVDEVDEDDEFEREKDTRKGRKSKRRRKGRTVVYDDETGETFVVRKRRRKQSDMWDEYGSDY